MTKLYDIEGLDCAHCAKRIEDHVNRMDGVECSLSFAMGRIKITAPDERFDKVMKEVRRIVGIVEPDARLSETR